MPSISLDWDKERMMTRRFLPPYLEKGAKGPRVLAFQLAIKALVVSYDAATDLVCDGVFGPATTNAVKALQSTCMDMDEADGKFGPRSQAAFAEKYFDLNSIPEDGFAGSTTWTKEDVQMGVWEGEMADDPRDVCRCSFMRCEHDGQGQIRGEPHCGGFALAKPSGSDHHGPVKLGGKGH